MHTRISVDTNIGVLCIMDRRVDGTIEKNFWQFHLSDNMELVLSKSSGRRWTPDHNLHMWKQARDIVVEHYMNEVDKILLVEKILLEE